MFRSTLLCALLLGAQIASAQAPAAPAAAKAKPLQPAFCAACHTLEPNQMGGYFESAAFKSQAMQLDVGTASPQILRFDPKALKVVDAGVEKKPDFLKDAKKRHEVQVTYVEKDGVKVVSEIRFKPPAKIDPANLIDYAGVAKLVAEGPAKTPYTLIDSRPLPRFQEGAIPPRSTSRSSASTSSSTGCQGQEPARRLLLRWHHLHAEPNSLKKAKQLGYTNLRVYREGQPEWAMRNYQVTTPEFVKAAYLDRDIPHVMIDARTASDATSGHIRVRCRCLRSGTGGAQVAARAQAQGASDRLRRSRRRPGRDRGAGPGQGRSAERAGAQRRHDRLAGGELCGGVGVPAPTKIAYAPKPRPARCRWPSSPRWPRTRRPTC